MARRVVLFTNLTAMLSGFALYMTWVILPDLLPAAERASRPARVVADYGFGTSVTVAGLWMLPTSLAVLGAGPLAGALGRRYGERLPLVAGMLLVALGSAGIATWHAEPWQPARRFILCGDRHRVRLRRDAQADRRRRAAHRDRRRHGHEHGGAHGRRRRRAPRWARCCWPPTSPRAPSVPTEAGLRRRLLGGRRSAPSWRPSRPSGRGPAGRARRRRRRRRATRCWSSTPHDRARGAARSVASEALCPSAENWAEAASAWHPSAWAATSSAGAPTRRPRSPCSTPTSPPAATRSTAPTSTRRGSRATGAASRRRSSGGGSPAAPTGTTWSSPPRSEWREGPGSPRGSPGRSSCAAPRSPSAGSRWSASTSSTPTRTTPGRRSRRRWAPSTSWWARAWCAPSPPPTTRPSA